MKVAEVEVRREWTDTSFRQPYDVFAPVYQHFFAPDAARVTWQIVNRLVLPDLAPGAHILDLCCGAGELTECLVRHGFRVTGIDNSESMLSLARGRAPQANFLLADVRDLPPKRDFDAVICAYNSLPHITGDHELAAVFLGIRKCLRDGGCLLFDVYSERAYRERWSGSFVKVDDEQVCIVSASYDPQCRLGENRVTLFRKQQAGEQAWRRSDLKLVTRAYLDDELHAVLIKAGFSVISNYEGARDLGIPEGSGRMFWLCK
ncbi:MAG TPA: class I SAM-dependent methyltransferase [Terriglobales bacterium]|nr:class I SAM-dependent methyltransferase [Terriglobales bacterium]